MTASDACPVPAVPDAVHLAAPAKRELAHGTAHGARAPKVREAPSLWKRSWRYVHRMWSNRILAQAIGIPLRHVLALYGLSLCLRGRVSSKTGLLALLLWPISGLGVTAGAHRYWTHHSYKASTILETLLMVMFSIADQGPIEGWALTHAMHHVASDTYWDPHNRSLGFWHAHIGWLFATKKFQLSSVEYRKVVRGLSPLVHFHDRNCLWWDPLWSLGLPSLLCSFWSDPWTGLFVAGALRWALVQHITFAVNSVAHGTLRHDDVYSFDPAADGVGPRVSLAVTLFSLGEGWHDYHHLFPWDYAAAELGALEQFNPTKVFIDVCYWLGLAHSRRRCSRRLQDLRRLQLLGLREEMGFGYEVAGIVPFRYKVLVKDDL